MDKAKKFLMENKITLTIGIGSLFAASTLFYFANPIHDNSGSKQNSASSFQSSLLIRLGGQEAVKLIVQRLFERLIGDYTLRVFFFDTNLDVTIFNKIFIEQIEQNLTIRILELFGAEGVTYQGRPLNEVHRRLKISNSQFDIMVQHFESTLNELDINQLTINDTLAQVKTLRNQIVTVQD